MDDILMQGLKKLVDEFPEEADFSMMYYSNNSNSLKEITDEDFRD